MSATHSRSNVGAENRRPTKVGVGERPPDGGG